MRAAAAGLLAIAAAGCSADVPQVTIVDKLRVLAVRATPPEIAPGDTATLDALVAQPDAPPDGSVPVVDYLWLACRQPAGSQLPSACGVTPLGGGGPDAFGAGDLGAASIPSCDAAPTATLCALGSTPSVTMTPMDTPGASGFVDVLITAVIADQGPGSALACARYASQGTGAPEDPDHCVISIKRLVVSTESTRNANPSLDQLELETALFADGNAFFLQPPLGMGQPTLTLAAKECVPGAAPNCQDGSNAQLQPDGTYEQLLVSWFATAGALTDQRTTLFPAATPGDGFTQPPPDSVATGWTVPTPAEMAQRAPNGRVHFWAVVRDNRDGVGWIDGVAYQR